jgi:indolepyruvate ferredoxin oxidoreductase alpha subunit
MTREAFDLSERFGIPVMVRITTRLAHSRAGVETSLPRKENPLVPQIDSTGWGLLPAFARKQYAALLEKQKELRTYTNTCAHNKLLSTEESSPFGVITAGLGRNYFLENVEDLGWNPPHLHIGAYPLPVEKIRSLASTVSRILVIEEGMPFIENSLLGVFPTEIRVSGKLDGSLPSAGELNPDLVRKALGLSPRPGVNGERSVTLPPRPPQLCAGCPHGDTYTALKKILAYFPDSVITSDIGCYALGALPPYAVPETIVCMGASIGMAIGAAEAGKRPAVAVIGDSTFLHSGVTRLSML